MSFLKQDEIQGIQIKCGETYRAYGAPHFVQRVQRFSQVQKKSGQKFRIVATICSSFHAVVLDFYRTPLV